MLNKAPGNVPGFLFVRAELLDVRLWPLGDIRKTAFNVRSWGQSGHDECTAKYPLMTQSGREADDMLRYLKLSVVSGLTPGGP
jgi:hypothetical protein